MEIKFDIDFSPTDLDEFVDIQVNKFVKDVTIEAHNQIVARTPVRTGRARAGWMFEFPADGEGRIYNDVEYIEFLEYGTVKMAPFAMVEVTLNNLEEKYK